MTQKSDAEINNLSFEEWQAQVPATILSERFWQLIAYQKGLYLYDLVWKDTTPWLSDIRGHELARQIVRSAGSITANIEEGFGRGIGKQLVYFYSVSLGSARETKGWYYRAKAIVTPQILQERISLVSEIVALLVTEINRQKHYLNKD
jgi:four helix bundle protein